MNDPLIKGVCAACGRWRPLAIAEIGLDLSLSRFGYCMPCTAVRLQSGLLTLKAGLFWETRYEEVPYKNPEDKRAWSRARYEKQREEEERAKIEQAAAWAEEQSRTIARELEAVTEPVEQIPAEAKAAEPEKPVTDKTRLKGLVRGSLEQRRHSTRSLKQSYKRAVLAATAAYEARMAKRKDHPSRERGTNG